MENILSTAEFDFIPAAEKEFLLAFDDAMEQAGYSCFGTIGDGYCWGKYMAIYTKKGVKSKKSYARTYIKDDGIVMRFYFSNVDKHSDAISSMPQEIKEVFTGAFGNCGYCHNQKEDGTCSHRKSYTIAGKTHEKCDGLTFWFHGPKTESLPQYMELFHLFYPKKKQHG